MEIYALGDLEPDIDPSAFVHPQATVIGNVRIGSNSSVWPQEVLRVDYGSIAFGSGSNVQDGAVVHATNDLAAVVGNFPLEPPLDLERLTRHRVRLERPQALHTRGTL